MHKLIMFKLQNPKLAEFTNVLNFVDKCKCDAFQTGLKGFCIYRLWPYSLSIAICL